MINTHSNNMTFLSMILSPPSGKYRVEIGSAE